MDAREFSIAALREMCKWKGLPVKGNKTELIKKLDRHDASGAWREEIKRLGTDDDGRTEGANVLAHSSWQERGNGRQDGRENEREEDRRDARDDVRGEMDRSIPALRLQEPLIGMGVSGGADTTDRQRTERELPPSQWRREQELLLRELDITRRERDMAMQSSATSRENNNIWSNLRQPIKAISELVSEFTGERDAFDRWARQFNLVRQTYSLDDNAARVLIGLKVKDQALKWFHSKPEHLETPIEDLLEEMRNLFDVRPAKVELRRQFEKREWKSDETFGTYFYDKVILAGRVPVNEDELVDYVIDGIPDRLLQNQARMQRFQRKDMLLRAFENIKLRSEFKGKHGRDSNVVAADKSKQGKPGVPRKDENKVEGTRCYNCNQTGHRMKECTKPKRERGSCYECGLQGHGIRDCPQKQKKTTPTAEPEPKQSPPQVTSVTEQIVADNEYLKFVDFERIGGATNYHFRLDTQLDTASPISLIKEKFVPRDWIEKIACERYEGINGSAVEIVGVAKLKVACEEATAEDVNLRVVTDGTMKHSALLGRDALRVLGLGLAKLPDEKESVLENEILNVEPSIFSGGEIDKLDINPELPSEIRDRVKEVIRTTYLEAERPEVPKIKAKFKIKVKTEQPFHFTPNRLSYDEKNKLREIIDKLLKNGVIRPSNSEYASRIVLVRKRDGSLRLCIDYRPLNKITERDNFPLPIIEEQIDELRGKRYYTLLDLKDGYHHVYMDEDSIKYTSFVTPFGQYEWLKMPFGPKNAPACFQRHVSDTLKEPLKSGNVVSYFDDVVIATDTLEEHYEVLTKVLQIFTENLLQLRLDKCHFVYEEIEFLGYVVSAKGIRPTKSGILAVRNFPTPQCVRDVQSFLGLSSYFRKFIKGFSLIAAPLYALLKKGVTFEFGVDQMESFVSLKQELTKAPILAIYDPKDETELHCDASSLGFGAVLLQKKEDNKFHPLFYFSKKTTEAEARYHSYELETLAIIYALRRFRVYLQGIPFKIVTDCSALVMTLNKKEINPRIARWALELQNYDYTTEHRSGKRMPHVDALSRIHHILVLEDNTFESNLSVSQADDANIKELKTRLEKEQDPFYEMRNGIIYRKKKDKIVFYVPSAMEQEVLHRYHNDFGHFGIDKTYAILQESFWFPNMKGKVKSHIKNCIKCIAFTKNTSKTEGLLHSIPKGDLPFMTVHIDHYGPVDRAHATKRHVLVVIDAFTKYVRLYAVKSTTSRESIKHLREYFQTYSRPKTLISDRGTCFTSKEFEDFMNEAGITHVKIATGSPQANGQVERVNRILGPALGKLYDGKDWHKSLGEIEFAINNTPNRSTGETPSQLLFGIRQRGSVIDALKDYVDETSGTLPRDLKELRTKASDRVQRAQKYNESYVNKKRKQARQYETDDFVMVKNFDTGPGKLAPAYKGPYRVIKALRNDRYVIGDIEGFQMSQKPYTGVWEAANLKPWRDRVDGDHETDSSEESDIENASGTESDNSEDSD